jgi:hypothetical protein
MQNKKQKTSNTCTKNAKTQMQTQRKKKREPIEKQCAEERSKSVRSDFENFSVWRQRWKSDIDDDDILDVGSDYQYLWCRHSILFKADATYYDAQRQSIKRDA